MLCVFCCLQHWLSDAEVSRLMQRYDLDNSGDLSAEEFEKLVSKRNMLRPLRNTLCGAWQVLSCHVASAVYEHILFDASNWHSRCWRAVLKSFGSGSGKSNFVKAGQTAVKRASLLSSAGE
jgi:hypothetical protein